MLLALVAEHVGVGAVLAGITTLEAPTLAAALAITLLTTTCCAWRWCLVARALGLPLSLSSAIAAYYRSQFLNTVLPGAVVGDVDRAVGHGRAAGDVTRGLRIVAWERAAGQVVQLALALILLLALPSPARRWLPAVFAVTVVAAVLAVAVFRGGHGNGHSFLARARRAVLDDVRHGLLPRTAWPGIVLCSVAATAGHTTILLLAARSLGSPASPLQLLPLFLLLLVSMSVPVGIAGWGPREGMAAWTFGAAGLGAAHGVGVAVAYGVLVFVACLPGAVVLIVAWLGRHHDDARPPVPSIRHEEGVAHG